MSRDISPTRMADISQRYIFENADLRGEIVQLEKSYQDLLALHEYAPGVKALLGEFLAASVLLSTTLKFDGKLILQARSEGEIPLLMVECSSDLGIRGIARGAQSATSLGFDQLLESGHLAITIEPNNGKRYQGIVPLEGNSLSTCLDAYFEQSEQLQTRLWLSTDGNRAAGMLLQQLPSQLVMDLGQRTQQWEHCGALAQTISDEELLQLPPQEILRRLFAQEPVRLFDPLPVRFQCTCSRERTLAALKSLGAEEVESILQEQGSVTMDCEFCNARYQFQREDLSDLVGDTPLPPTLH